MKLNTVIKVYPSEANFLLVEFNDADFMYKALVERKVIVRNRSNVVENCIRITVGSPIENNQLINEIKLIENEKSTVY